MQTLRSLWSSIRECLRPTPQDDLPAPAASSIPPVADQPVDPSAIAEGAVFLHTSVDSCVHAVWRSTTGDRDETTFTAPGTARTLSADLALSAFAWIYQRASVETGTPVPVWVGHRATRRGLMELAGSFPAVRLLDRLGRIAPAGCPAPAPPAPSTAPAEPSEPLVVATDASVGCRAEAGIACVAEGGAYAQGFAPTRDVTLAELLAIRLALTTLAGPLIVLTDSRSALSRIQHPSTATAKQRAVVTEIHRLRRGRAVAFRWVKGHNGHALNEAADRLAVAARRAHEFNQTAHIRRQIAAGIVADLGAQLRREARPRIAQRLGDACRASVYRQRV